MQPEANENKKSEAEKEKKQAEKKTAFIFPPQDGNPRIKVDACNREEEENRYARCESDGKKYARS
jgi:ABC-type Na+ efflux pump permease subunit